MPLTIAEVTAYLPSRRLLWRVRSVKFPSSPSSGGISPVPMPFQCTQGLCSIASSNRGHSNGVGYGKRGGHRSIVSVMIAREREPLSGVLSCTFEVSMISSRQLSTGGARKSRLGHGKDTWASVCTTHNNRIRKVLQRFNMD